MKSSASGVTTAAIVMATAMTASVAGPHRAYAAPSPTVAQSDDDLAIVVLSPKPHTNYTGSKPIEVSAFYQGTDSNAIASIELYVDGTNAYTKHLEAPEARGVISFLIDASQLSAGTHAVVVRAVAVDAEVVSQKTSFVYVSDAPAVAPQVSSPEIPATSALPELSYVTPVANENVSGTVKIELKATAPDGKDPYVSLFIDRTFKTLRNYAPYEYDWDTTGYTNGYHTIEAYGYDDAQNVGPAQVLRVYVNNPGGQTPLRTDLTDTPAPVRTVAAFKHTAPISSPAGRVSRNHAVRPTPMMIAARTAGVPDTNLTDTQLSDPFIPSTATGIVGPSRSSVAPGLIKATGAARRPSPLLSMESLPSRFGLLRPVMMAKRLDLLDQTGGLHPESQLSDPYIPDTATPIPARQTATPAAGFKPMPVARVSGAPVVSESGKTALAGIQAPSLITRDAHTVQVMMTEPTLTRPSLKTIAVSAARVSIKIATPVIAKASVKIAAPVAQKASIKVAVPVAKPVVRIAVSPASAIKLNAAVSAAPRVIAIHTAAPALQRAPYLIHTPAASLLRAKGQMKVMFNAVPIRIDRPLAAREGVMFGPIRQIFEYQGGSLTWQQRTGIVHAQSDTKDIVLKIGDRQATVNSKATTMQAAPYLAKGRTMVPLSFLPQALDVNVQYDKVSGHLLITTRK
ncbi:MAG: stalk domain-containing protein [Capsulimonadaceae bacterium]